MKKTSSKWMLLAVAAIVPSLCQAQAAPKGAIDSLLQATGHKGLEEVAAPPVAVAKPAQPSGVEEQLNKAKNLVEITDVTYKGLPFLAVAVGENWDKMGMNNYKAVQHQATRAESICRNLGYGKPSASSIEWRKSGDSKAHDVLYFDDAGNLVQTSETDTHVYAHNSDFAVFKTLSCAKLTNDAK